MGGLGQIRRAIEQARQLRDAAGMVGVLVGDQDGVDALGLLPAQRFQAAQQFLLAKSGVNEEGGVLGFEQRAVARAARSQNGDPERDACSLRVTPARSQLARQHREGSWQNCRSASIKTGEQSLLFSSGIAGPATNRAGPARRTSPSRIESWPGSSCPELDAHALARLGTHHIGKNSQGGFIVSQLQADCGPDRQRIRHFQVAARNA